MVNDGESNEFLDQDTGGTFDTKESRNMIKKSSHTLGFLGAFFESGGNQMMWSYHYQSGQSPVGLVDQLNSEPAKS